MAPIRLKQTIIITQINCKFPSNLLRTISTIATMGNRKKNKLTINITINSCGPIIPKSAIKVVLKVSYKLMIRLIPY